jgi:hypothetical protein
MVRIRYIGKQLIARAFNRTFHRKHWDDDHGLETGQIAILGANPQFEVHDASEREGSTDPVEGGTAA